MPFARQFHFPGQTPLSADSLEINPADLATMDARVQVGDPDACWPFIPKPRYDIPASDSPRYYPVYVTNPDGGRMIALQAHRVALVRAKGPIASDLVACHECDNPSCCNPGHIRGDTSKGNAEDRKRPTSVERERMLADTTMIRMANWIDKVQQHQAELAELHRIQRDLLKTYVEKRRLMRTLPPKRRALEASK